MNTIRLHIYVDWLTSIESIFFPNVKQIENQANISK